MGLTRKDLETIIREVTVPLIKEHAGTGVAEVVREAVALELAKTPKAANIGALVTDGGTNAPRRTHDGAEKGTLFARYLRCLAVAKNDKERAAQVAKAWGYAEVADALARSQEKAMAAGDPLAGGFLVPEEFSADVIELLRASGVVRSLNPTTIPMTSGSIKIPRITTGVSAAYVGENTAITKSQAATGQLTLTWKKLAALVPISNDLLRYSMPQADTIVRDDAIRALSAREDLAFIVGDGLDGTPRGLKNLIHADNKFATTAGNTLATITAALGAAMQRIMDANITLITQQGATGGIDTRPGWIFAPRTWQRLTTVQTTTGAYAFRDEMLRGTLWGYPFRVTTQVPITDGSSGTASSVYFGCFAHAVIGEAQGLEVSASQEAAYVEGGVVQAAFSLDQTVIRVLAEHDFALRHDKSFALIQDVDWT